MNNYQIYDEVGKGRFSSVYKGRRKKTIEYYAISSIEKSQRQRVLTNVKFLRSAQHPRVIKFHNWYETNNHLWVITELCAGGDMRQVLNLDTRLSLAAVRLFAGDIAEGLMYIHSRGVVYGDLRPSNILMDSTMSLRFYDFSLSCDFAAARDEGKVGTPVYMAPELFTPDGVPSMASDLWSFGVLLYEMSTGKPPFEGSDLPALLTSIMTRPLECDRDLPDDLRSLMVSLLQKNPLERSAWSVVVQNAFWQGRLQCPATPFPQQPAFEAYGKHHTTHRAPPDADGVTRRVEWAVENAKRNYTSTQSASEGGPPKGPSPNEEVDFTDRTSGSAQESFSRTFTEANQSRRDSNDRGAREVSTTQSQFHRQRERVRSDGVTTTSNRPETSTKSTGLSDLRLDELLSHATDAHIRPLVLNSRIERFVEQKYDSTKFGFNAPSKSQLRTFNEQQQADFITTVYRTLSSSSLQYEEKFNFLCYFETVCADGSIANFIINSSIMMLCLKMASQRHAPSNYRSTAASVMSILVRHATFIHTDLAKADIFPSIIKVFNEEDSPRVKRKLIACLGEFLIYIAVQQERYRAVWGVDTNATFGVYEAVLADTDDVLRHYAVRTVENIATVNDKSIAINLFARPEIVKSLLIVYDLPPASTRSEHMRSSALCAALKLAMLHEKLIPIVMESKHLPLVFYGKILTASITPKSAQCVLTFCNMVLSKSLVAVQNPIVAVWGEASETKSSNIFASSQILSHTAQSILSSIFGVAEDLLSGLCEGSDNATVAMKGKSLLFLVLLGCADETLLGRLLTERLVAHIDFILREKDSYVQRCAACLACYLGTFVESHLSEVSKRASAVSLQAVCQVMSAPNITAMIDFSDAVYATLGSCVEKALTSSRYAAHESAFNQLAEHLAQTVPRLSHSRRATAAASLVPPYLNMLRAPSGERRFSALRLLSALVAPLDADAAEGRALDHVLAAVAPALPPLLREREPVPVHAVRLLVACGERRLGPLAAAMTPPIAEELIAYMRRARGSDMSAPLRLLLLAMQTARAAEVGPLLASGAFCQAVLLQSLHTARATEADHLLEPCCELAAVVLRHAQGAAPALLPPRGLCELWLPLCAAPVRSAGENAAGCVHALVRASAAAQEEILSPEGLHRVREVLADTRDNPNTGLHIVRAIRFACGLCRRRELHKLPPWLPAALEVMTREGNADSELAEEAAATLGLLRG